MKSRCCGAPLVRGYRWGEWPNNQAFKRCGACGEVATIARPDIGPDHPGSFVVDMDPIEIQFPPAPKSRRVG